MDTKQKSRGGPGKKREKSQFRTALEQKGWAMKELADRWGITPISLSRQTKEPDTKTWDALNGLPDKRGGNEQANEATDQAGDAPGKTA